MDWLRSAYDAPMLQTLGGEPVLVRWYRADEGAEVFPLPHDFGSLNWAPEKGVFGDLGEQDGPRPWADSSKPPNGYIGDADSVSCVLSRSDWWETGLPEGESYGPYDDDGVPICCTQPCTCLSPQYDEMEVLIEITSGDCEGLQLSAMTTRPDPEICRWEASGSSSEGSWTITISYAGDSIWSIDAWTCTNDTAIIGVGETGACPTGEVVWEDLTVNNNCCSDLPVTAKVTLTLP